MTLLIPYQFKNESLLQEALTHNSTVNQRLEFLGDRVISTIIAHILYNQFTDAKEGQLSLMLAGLVNRQSMAKLAKHLNIPQHMILTNHEDHNTITDNPRVLCDTLESIIAAIYLDSDYLTVYEVVKQLWESQLQQIASLSYDNKSRLQHFSLQQGWPLPVYTILHTEGKEHQLFFTSQVQLHNKLQAQGSGYSKKSAEQNAASKLLTLLKHEHKL